ncbi:hypothetical protein TNIN_88941 [Trichonephila inaurata madagascariensis]|uniref:Uncharacterized protein n=1 Tax=Trichonephila inaurata madagascariensis TaxID=2747483 RepID=A0A8X6X5B9_9ARAC|nr:hypothetical protein TNIN_88941 [Trichonephila inaurata madagascariensis]
MTNVGILNFPLSKQQKSSPSDVFLSNPSLETEKSGSNLTRSPKNTLSFGSIRKALGVSQSDPCCMQMDFLPPIGDSSGISY